MYVKVGIFFDETLINESFVCNKIYVISRKNSAKKN